MMNWPKRRMAGFTLIEIMVTVIVLVILMTVAVPNLQEMIKNNRVTAQGNELVSIVNFARNEAIRRTESVTVVLERDGFSWSAEVLDPDGAGVAGCAGSALRCAGYDKVALELNLAEGGDSRNLVFNNRGYLDPFQEVELALEHENCTGNLQRRLLTLLPTGQVESCRTTCGSNTCD